MVPIVINKKGYIDNYSFEKYIIATCQKHKEEKRALAFSFLVYDFENVNITQILENKEYWSSLDKISGKYLSVFYLNSKNEYYEKRQKEIYKEKQRASEQNRNEGWMSFLVPLSFEKTPLEKTIEYLKNEFNIADEIKTPFLLFFQTEGEQIIDSFIITLKEDKIEDGFLELKKYLKKAAKSLKTITEEDYSNQVVFDLLKVDIKEGLLIKVGKAVIKKLNINLIFAIIRTLGG